MTLVSNHFSLFTNEEKDILCHQYLNILFQSLHNYRVDDDHIKNNIAKTYGEVLFTGLTQIFSSIQLSETDVFVDLGSGIGKLVVHAFLKTKIKEAMGIEFIPELHERALHIAQKIKKDLPAFFVGDRKLSFLLGDFLTIPLSMATVAFICSPCYTQECLHALGKIINNTTSIHTVLSLRPLTTLHRLPFKKVIRVECSWDSALCYVYGQ